MYKKQTNRQLTIYDFDQPLGLTMNPENRWVKKAASIPWSVIEDKYAALFNSDRGNIAKPVRMALGALIIQSEFQYSDIETVNQIRENPYLQYFVGLHAYKDEKPFDASLMVHFRKRLSSEILIEINELILNPPEDVEKDSQVDDNDDDDNDSSKSANEGTLLLDATCAPSEIKFPQDTELLNECREKLEGIIDAICEANHLLKPRTYRKVARKDYLHIARKKKKHGTQIRKAIGKQLNYIRRDFGDIDAFLNHGYTLVPKQAELLATLRKLYEQQLYMYTSRTHKVQDRIVSISQPFIRPIVRGKAKNPVEFGAKLDMSITNGYARIEKISFDAYNNESECLIVAVERYKERMGVYPERVLADKIYRNRTNLSYCKQLGIRLSEPSLGRPKKDQKVDKKQEYIDNCNRVEVERGFSLAKRKYGLRLIRTRLEETSLCVIALSILTMNLSKVSLRIFLTIIRWMRLPRMEPLVIP